MSGLQLALQSAISLSATVVCTPKGRACSLCRKLGGILLELQGHGWAVGTMIALLCEVISPLLSRAGVTLECCPSLLACLQVWQGRSCFGGMPAEESRLHGEGTQGNTREGNTVIVM